MLYLDDKKTIEFDDNNFWSNETKFWNNYGKIYRHLEAATPYKKMLDDIFAVISKKNHSSWLDAGCGPGTMIDFLIKKNIKYKSIVGLDFDGVMVDQASKRLSHINNVSISTANLAKKLQYPDAHFDSIIANLVLSYVIIFDGKYVGNNALKEVLREMYRLLSIGGTLLWTTPVDNVNFSKVFFASWRQTMNPLRPYIFYGPRVLSYALKIQNKGKRGIYHFISSNEIYRIMEEVGFKNISIQRTFANQAYLISANK